MQKKFIFDDNDGEIRFVGDFEALYRNKNDPWNQSGDNSNLQRYYNNSRKNLLQKIDNLDSNKYICEIGCGLGYVANMLHNKLAKSVIDGVDISTTAIKKASSMFSDLSFYVGDVCSIDFNIDKRYNIVILNQILWYILKDLEQVFSNMDKILEKNGYLIISTLFLKEQRYGNDIIGSFDELINYCYKNHKERYRLINADIDYGDITSSYRDSILILQKISK